MLKYRVFLALPIGIGFVALVFLVMMSLGSNLAIAMIAIALLMPGIGLVHAIALNCCKSPLPMLAANGLIYATGAFIFVWLGSRGAQKETLRRFAFPVTLLVVGAVTLGWGTAGALGWVWSAPSDEALTRKFNQHRGDLETLASMAQTDSSVSRIADDFIWRNDSVAWPRPESEWGITADRWKEYRQRFRKIGLTAGLNKDSQDNVYFISHVEGSVVGGMSKGFVYCEKTALSATAEGHPPFLPCIQQRNSGRSEDAKGNGSEYRRLDERWYIYSEWD
jgi:hypothetical protein